MVGWAVDFDGGWKGWALLISNMNVIMIMTSSMIMIGHDLEHEYDFEVAECIRLVAPIRMFANESWEECSWCPDDKRESAGFEPCRLPEMSDCRLVNASKDFFLSAMGNDDDRDAGLPKRKCNAII